MPTTQLLHQASQYLAAAGNSFLPKQSDDSHTNLLWRTDIESLTTRELNASSDVLALSFESYSLDFLNPVSGIVSSYALEGARHLDIVNWIERERQLLGIEKEFTSELHYELPYAKVEDEFHFPSANAAELQRLSKMRSQADGALKYSVEFFYNLSEIRIWPHHFDTGGLGSLNNAENMNNLIDTVGVGLAIPDSNIDDYYYYASGWNGSVQPDLANAGALSEGEWVNTDWKGAVLRASGATDLQVKTFFKEAIKAYSELGV